MNAATLPQPEILVDQEFQDIDSLGRAAGWDLDFRQLDNGPFEARLRVFGHLETVVVRVEFNLYLTGIVNPSQGLAGNTGHCFRGRFNLVADNFFGD